MNDVLSLLWFALVGAMLGGYPIVFFRLALAMIDRDEANMTRGFFLSIAWGGACAVFIWLALQ